MRRTDWPALLIRIPLRRADATLARGKGMKIEDLSEILGHANPTVTQSIYVTVFDPVLKDAAENFAISPEGKSLRSPGGRSHDSLD